MSYQKISFKKREILGSKVRKLRKKGNLPAVIYGNNISNIPITIDYKDFMKIYRKEGTTSIINLIKEEDSSNFFCLIHDLDIHPVKDTILHVDFLSVDLKKETLATVPLEFINSPSKESDGVLIKNISEIEIQVLPENIPHSILVDLSVLNKIGDIIHISDLLISDKFKIIEKEDLVVASLVQEKEEIEENENLVSEQEQTLPKNAEVEKKDKK